MSNLAQSYVLPAASQAGKAKASTDSKQGADEPSKSARDKALANFSPTSCLKPAVRQNIRKLAKVKLRKSSAASRKLSAVIQNPGANLLRRSHHHACVFSLLSVRFFRLFDLDPVLI